MAPTGRQLTIEVTEEMIAAGARALCFSDSDTDADVARRVLLASLNVGGYQVQDAVQLSEAILTSAH
jgi:hypothetical protein